MDYATSHVFYCVLLLLVTLALTSMALADRRVIGTRWMLLSTSLELAKVLLQGMDGRVSRVFTVLVANELNLLAFFTMYVGYRWFVWRKPFRSAVPVVATGAVLLLYAAMFLEHWRMSFQAQGTAVLWICGCSVWLLLWQREARFLVPGRIASGLLVLHMMMLGYRMVVALTPQRYSMQPGGSWADPRWMYSMLVVLFLGACLLATYVWLAAAEMVAYVAETAERDALTGSWNRRALGQRASVLLSKSLRERRPMSIVGLDLDFFKRVNDTFGHGAGDAVLCEIVEVARRCLRSKDVLARTGGEEFLLLLPQVDGAGAFAVAERVRKDVEAMRVVYEGDLLRITVSAGVTEMLPAGDTWQAMMRRADTALYAAKSAGRNCVVLDKPAGTPSRGPVLVLPVLPAPEARRPYLIR